MLIIKRYLSHFLGIITWLYFETIIFKPTLLLYFSGVYLIILVLSLVYLQRKRLNKIEKISYFLLPIIFLTNSVIFFLHFNFSLNFLHLLALLLGVVMWLYLESFFLKNYFANFYKKQSFENATENIIIFTSFLFFVNFFSLRIYDDLKYPLLFNLSFLVLFALNWCQISFNGLNPFSGKNFFYVVLNPILSLQILFVSIFLPTNSYSLALINAVIFYNLIFFSRYFLLSQLSVKMTKKLLTLSTAIVVLTILFSNWT
jgi:hypothetical protein